jgi:dipeptidyl aminopeptidase/acylaminoacyl peptidase
MRSPMWAMAALLVSQSCSGPTAPGYQRYKAVATLDSYAASGQVRLFWFTSTNYDCIDFGCPPDGPPIARVALVQSSVGPERGFANVASRNGGGVDSAIITGLVDGKTYWFEVIGYDARGKAILSSRPVMTVIGPQSEPTGAISAVPTGRLSWSPTGDSLVYVESVSMEAGEMRFIDMATLSTHALGAAGPPSQDIFDAEWSPTGDRIAYTYAPTRTAGAIDYRVRVANLSDSSQQTVTLGRVDFDGAWASDTRIYYCRGTYDPPNIYQIWRVDVGSSEGPRPVTNDAIYKFHPSVRSSDELIAFEGTGDGYLQHSLYLCNPRVGGETRLTRESWCSDTNPSWAPDGQHVVFMSDRSGHGEVWSVNASTGAMTQLTRGVRGTKKKYARISGDGRRLAVVDGDSWAGHPARLEFYNQSGTLP